MDNEFFTSAIFSPHHPNLILGGTCIYFFYIALGKIYFYKIKDKTFKILHKIERKLENSMLTFPVINIKFNPRVNNIISVSYNDGITELIRLSQAFTEYKFDEINRISKMINSLMI